MMHQLRALSLCLFAPDDIVEVRYLPASDGQAISSWHRAADLPGQADNFHKLNLNYHLYFGCNPRKDWKARDKAGVSLARTLCVEWDDTTWGEAWSRIRAAGLPDPTLVLWSGGGPHCYWRLEQPILRLDQWTECQKGLIDVLGSDKCIHDAPRIMRLPGTWNHRREQRALILWAAIGNRYKLDELFFRIQFGTSTESPRKVNGKAALYREPRRGSVLDRARKYLESCPPSISGAGGHKQAFRVVRAVVWGFGVRGEEAASLLEGWNARCQPAWSERELRHKIREAETKSFGKPRGYLVSARARD